MLTKDFISLVASASGLSKKKVELLLNTSNAIIRENLMAGKAIQLQGLGTLELKEKNERVIAAPEQPESLEQAPAKRSSNAAVTSAVLPRRE